MNEQKFQKGDAVTIRPFDEVDMADMGRLQKSAGVCYGIDREYINERTDRFYRVAKHMKDNGAHVYKLENELGLMVPYCWAQGMLYSANEESTPEPDTDGLFGLLGI